MSYNSKLSGNGVGVDRMRIHLKKTNSQNLTDYELFNITETTQNGITYLVISPKKGDENESNTKKYFVM